MKKFLRNHGLTFVLVALFMSSWVGQLLAGQHACNAERRDHHHPPLSLPEYVVSGDFWQATGENWESEFLQMAMFVLLTTCLYQKGSPESRNPDEAVDPRDEDPRERRDDPSAPYPVRCGSRFLLWVYSHSLSLTFSLLFVASFWIHAAGGAVKHNQQQRDHGQPPVTTLRYIGTSQFWSESFQNWQSEFLSLAAMVWLSVYLRERGSAESKPVAAAHSDQE